MYTDTDILTFIYFLEKIHDIVHDDYRDMGDRYINSEWNLYDQINIEYGFSGYEEHNITELNVKIINGDLIENIPTSKIVINKNTNVSSVYSETGIPEINTEILIFTDFIELQKFIIADYFSDYNEKLQ
jgi:hypothetical protein